MNRREIDSIGGNTYSYIYIVAYSGDGIAKSKITREVVDEEDQSIA